MPTSIAGGTLTLSDAAEHNFAAADITNRIYVLTADLTNMVLGDLLRIRCYTKVKSGGAERISYDRVFSHLPLEPALYSVAVPAQYSCRFSAQALSGAQHAYDFNIESWNPSIASIATGTLTLSDANEHNLSAADTSNKVYVPTIDLTNMVNGDALRIRQYVIVKSGGAERIIYDRVFQHVQAEPGWIGFPVPAEYSYRCSLTAVSGAQHGYDFNIMAWAAS